MVSVLHIFSNFSKSGYVIMGSFLSLFSFYYRVMGIDPLQPKLFYGQFVFFMMWHQSRWTCAGKGSGAPRLNSRCTSSQAACSCSLSKKNFYFNFIFLLIEDLLQSGCKFENNGCSPPYKLCKNRPFTWTKSLCCWLSKLTAENLSFPTLSFWAV